MDITSVNGNNSWKNSGWYDDGNIVKKGVTDGQTDRQTKRKKCSKSCLVAAKILAFSSGLNVSTTCDVIVFRLLDSLKREYIVVVTKLQRLVSSGVVITQRPVQPMRKILFISSPPETSVLHFHFTEFCSLGSNLHYVSIGSGNGLAPKRRQAIIWTKADLVYRRIYAALGEVELNGIYISVLLQIKPVIHWKYSRSCIMKQWHRQIFVC